MCKYHGPETNSGHDSMGTTDKRHEKERTRIKDTAADCRDCFGSSTNGLPICCDCYRELGG